MSLPCGTGSLRSGCFVQMAESVFVLRYESSHNSSFYTVSEGIGIGDTWDSNPSGCLCPQSSVLYNWPLDEGIHMPHVPAYTEDAEMSTIT